MEILREMNKQEAHEYISLSTNTKHSHERKYRKQWLGKEIHKVFLVDKGHRNGPEVHVVFENASIGIYNQLTRRYITCLIARPGQIMRYGITDTNMLSLARDNQLQGRNF